MQKEVIILAGGLGTRLRDVVPDVPKCMAPINNKPFLYYLIRYLESQGVNRFILSLGYKSENVISYIKKFHSGIDIVFVVESTPLGTGGAIKAALKEAKSDFTLIVNGDTFFNIKLDDFYLKAKLYKSSFSIALISVEKNYRYGYVEINESNEIIQFCEKTETYNVLVNSGFYIINREKINFDTYSDVFSLEKDYFESGSRNVKIYGVEFKNDFIDIGIPDDFYKAQSLFNQLKLDF